MLAIGLYLRGKANLQMMEQYKLRCLQLLLKQKNELSVDRYVNAMHPLKEKAQKCYAKSIELEKDEFVRMMLLDGCFMIEVFRKLVEEDNRDDPILKSVRKFLNCLVNSPKDAEMLSHCGIIDNWLGDDKAVSSLLNKLGNNVILDSASFCYSQTFNKVNKRKEVLRIYEATSGQQINLEKSAMVCSRNVTEEVAEEVRAALGVVQRLDFSQILVVHVSYSGGHIRLGSPNVQSNGTLK
ncbi:unnamed protein product [Ilex paraguariensis]|uniref:Uncharacterized protein n=1 Tax=Ilex paraguariensis TaxID=185542 RepID=A0ABC8SFB7_9AQUA